MRLSGKTLELSIIAQLSERLAILNALWLGLTQKEKKNWGFYAASELGETLNFRQFKASNTIMGFRSIHGSRRRFKIPHAQLPGRPGWLPTQAPHRPVRAGLPHTVLQVTGSLRGFQAA